MRAHWNVSRRDETSRRLAVRIARALVAGPALAVALVLACAGAAVAADGGEAAPPLRRDVLAIYDAGRESEPRATRVHRFLELALNHLGYRVVYRSAESGRPVGQEVDRLAATISWFDAPLPAAEAPTWVTDLIRSDGTRPKAIAFGHPGVPLTPAPEVARDAYLLRLGLRLAGAPVRLGSLSRVVVSDGASVESDAAFAIAPGTYDNLAAADPAGVQLRIVPDSDPSAGIDLVLASESGGYVANLAALASDPRLASPLWLLDVYRFLGAVLEPPLFPIPDASTALGRRLFFATVTPEGWTSNMPASRYGEPTVLAADLVVEMLARQFPDVPASVAVVTGDLDPAVAGRDAQAARAAARALFALPQIEIATAGESYVRDWSFFEDYRVDREEGRIAELGRSAQIRTGGLINTALRSLGDAFADRSASEQQASAATPRKYVTAPFELDREIGGALDVVADLAGRERRAGLFVWSGDARPFVAAVEAATVPAIGGGGGVVDPFASPFGGLWPPYARVGDRLQVYHALSGELAYAGGFMQAPWRLRALSRALAATGAPLRLKPFEVSFSAGSLVEFGRRQAVYDLLGQARSEELLPVWPSTYVAMVAGLAAAEVVVLGPMRWRIEERGSLATVRFDRSEGLALDLGASEGVLGARRNGATLYVSLDPANAAPVVALMRAGGRTGVSGSPDAISIEASRWLVSEFERGACDARLAARGFGAGDMVLVGPPGRAVRVEMAKGAAPDRPVFWATIVADEDGRIPVSLPPTPDPVLVTVSGLCGS